MYPIKWSLVGLLWLTYFLNYVDRQVLFSLLPALRADIPMTNLELGWVGSLFIWCYSLASPLGGRLADRYGARVMVLSSVLLFSVATLITGLSQSAVSLLTGRALLGVTESFYFPAAVSLLGSVHSSEVRSRAISLHGCAQFAGAAFGGWFGGWMTDRNGWRISFLCLAAAGLVWGGVLMAGLRRTKPTSKSREERDQGCLQDLFDGRFGALVFAFFMVCAILWMLYAWLPTFLYERYALTLSESGWKATLFLQSGSIVGILAGGVIGDWISRQFDGGRLLLASGALLASTPFAVLILSTRDLWIASEAAVCFGFFAGLMLANNVAAAYDLVPARAYGFAAGVLTLAGGLAGGLSILFSGAWKDTLGIELLMRWTAIGTAVSAVLLAVVVWRYPRRLLQT